MGMCQIPSNTLPSNRFWWGLLFFLFLWQGENKVNSKFALGVYKTLNLHIFNVNMHKYAFSDVCPRGVFNCQNVLKFKNV